MCSESAAVVWWWAARADAGWCRSGEANLFRLQIVLLERLGDGLRVRLHQVDQLGELVGGTARLRLAEPSVEGVRVAAREVAVVEPREEDRLGCGFVAIASVHVAPRISAPRRRAPIAVRRLAPVVG